jgi:hypothetical protein
MLGLFDRPADEKALEALLKSPAIPGLTDPLIELPYNRLWWPNPCAQKAFPLPLYPCPEIKTILGRTLVFHFTFKLGRGPFCRGLPPIRASAFDILKLAGSSSRLPGPLPRRRFPRTIFFERCFKGSFVCPVLCVSIFEKVCKIPPVGSGSRHLVMLLIDYVLCLVPIRVRTRGGVSMDIQDDQFMLWIISWA